MVAVAQLVEHRIVIPSVAGSSPVGYPIFYVNIEIGRRNHKIPDGFFGFGRFSLLSKKSRRFCHGSLEEDIVFQVNMLH